LPVEAWLDGQGRVVQFHMTMPLTIEGEKVTMDMSINFFDYGTPVHIVAPKL
jgi:hypothetical protein